MSTALKNYKWNNRWPSELFIMEVFSKENKKMKGVAEYVEVDLYWYSEEGIVEHLMTEKFESEEISVAKELCERICEKNSTTEYSGKIKSYHMQ